MTQKSLVRGVEISASESERLHLDWRWKCRTCRYWTGDMTGTGDIKSHSVLVKAPCGNQASELYQEVTTTDGRCQQWDSWDETERTK